ncbi:hypothetical protein PV327_008820 [Microctonus hyperodae]|uniref:Uncharacterized protein n=1 Tax=Microctonus hyperodae TaxID=165561 RepID=A0AA39FSI2_MICHY|nr:hypothetical protein PV327_008820 [Microctonus hyperodae]
MKKREIRVNEQLVLTCMHTLMAREHNRIAKALSQVNSHWDDETVFQEARRINIAEIQHVTYNEFLPILLGKDVMEKFGLLLEKNNYWDGYDPNVNPSVIDAFAAAAFRFGHSLLPTAVERWSKAHKFIASKRLSDLIRRPWDLYRAGVIDEYFMGLMNQVAQAMDDSITQEVKHPADVDLWSGGVSERPLPGSMLGPTFACVIATQFSNSRRGDRFWYELPNQPSSFTLEQLNEIRKSRLSRLICDNTDLIDTIQLFPMVLPDHEINPRVPCKSGVLPSIDFNKWAEFPASSHAAQYANNKSIGLKNSITQLRNPKIKTNNHLSMFNNDELIYEIVSKLKQQNDGKINRAKRSLRINKNKLKSKRQKKQYFSLSDLGVKRQKQVPKVDQTNKIPAYTRVVQDCKNDDETSEITDLNNSPIKSNYSRIVVVDPDHPNVHSTRRNNEKIITGHKSGIFPLLNSTNESYINLQDYQITKQNSADVNKAFVTESAEHNLTYDPNNIPYVDVPDYTDKREESLDKNDRDAAIIKEKNRNNNDDINNDAIDPGTPSNVEEKEGVEIHDRSESSEANNENVDRKAKYSMVRTESNGEEGDSTELRRQLESDQDSSGEITSFENKEIKNDEKKSEEQSSLFEPINFDINDYKKSFNLDEFIGEMFKDDKEKDLNDKNGKIANRRFLDSAGDYGFKKNNYFPISFESSKHDEEYLGKDSILSHSIINDDISSNFKKGNFQIHDNKDGGLRNNKHFKTLNDNFTKLNDEIKGGTQDGKNKQRKWKNKNFKNFTMKYQYPPMKIMRFLPVYKQPLDRNSPSFFLCSRQRVQDLHCNRKDIQRKDSFLHCSCTKSEVKSSKLNLEDSDNEEIMIYVTELQKIQTTYRDELEKREKERELLNEENNNLKEINEKLTTQLSIFETDLKTIENSDDEIKILLASRSKECAEKSVNLIIATRKCKTMEELLNKETIKIYNIQKEAFASESTYKKLIADMEKQNDLLENSLKNLKNNLSNSVTKIEFNELKEKYNEINLRLRTLYEFQLITNNNNDDKLSNDEYKLDKDKIEDESLGEINEEMKQKELSNQNNYDKILKINSHLQEQLLQTQNLLIEKLQLPQYETQDNKIIELQNEIKKLRIENENLLKSLTISRDEAQMYYTINSLKILEVDNLRHQILDLQAISEDKETIARLGFELNSYKTAEMEINRNKSQLENEILQLRNKLNTTNDKYTKAKLQFEEFRRHCDNKIKNYENVIYYLNKQYSGFTSLSSLMRYEIMLKNLANDRAKIDLQLKETKDNNEKVKTQQETLTNRLEIVDRLKDILEQQIGSSDLDNLLQKFSENSQIVLNEFRLKRKIKQLESDLQTTTDKLIQYETIITTMEYEMINIQNIWKNKIETSPKIINNLSSQTEINFVSTDKKSVYVEACVECYSTEQLNEALSLASDRSLKLIKYESQIAEYEAKITALNNGIIEKDLELVEQRKIIEQQKSMEKINLNNVEDVDNIAIKSSINSLQKIINQKEETITRYQLLLKEDRDEHSKAAARLQEEIKNVRHEMAAIKQEGELIKSQKLIIECDKLNLKSSNELKRDPKVDVEAEEKIVRLTEQVSTLEADLNIVYELSERWRRLADERLNHMDKMREKLEDQHKNELDSYRLELDKWQSESAALRQQLSENRMKLSKGNISLSKELQERDNKIEELTMLNQQLQSEIEMMESMGQLQPQMSGQNSGTIKIQEITQNYNRNDLSNHGQSELDFLRRQQKSIIEKEKLYKEQIADLRQQLSRRYMAEKTEEKRVSQREAQLERKLKNMEDELNKARIQLDREYRNQEAKRIKTAEELSLWEKQKKWQQIAEKLKKELKDKSDEYKKLNVSYDKLKTIVSCMEREKWYLRSKIRSENGNLLGRLDFEVKIVEDLQNECQTLRNRISELTDRLKINKNEELIKQIEQQKQRIVALELVTEGNEFVVDQLEKLESTKCILEKANIKLESENFELRMEIEKQNLDTPRLKEKVEHLEKYIELLKVEKSSESSEKDHEQSSKKSVIELERTIFVLKRIVEKLQVENKRLRINSKNNHRLIKSTSNPITNGDVNETNFNLKKQYEQTKKRVIALETDLQLADQRIEMLIAARKDDDNTDEIQVLKQQLAHKSELLDKVKQLLTRAAMNEKALRQRVSI